MISPPPPPRVWKFGEFQFDAERLVLYHHGELVKGVEKKSLEVLAALLRRPGELVPHEEIIERVWRDNPYGVTPARVNQYVSKLQKLFGQYEPDQKFIENLKGRGYIFTSEVHVTTSEVESGATALEHLSETSPFSKQITTSGVAFSSSIKDDADYPLIDERPGPSRGWLGYRYVLAGLAMLSVALFTFWKFYPQTSDEDEIRRVVKDSQLYESLVLYKNPSAFREEDLDQYWTSELDIGSNYDRRRIREAVKKLVDEGRRYGDETKCEQFDFQSVEINKAGDMAIVKTLEKWFVAVYFADGTLQRNRYVGPYFVSYILRKIDGRWLIEKSNTARVNRPTPQVSGIESMSEVRPGEQFTVRISGQDFEAETVYLQVTGPGCPVTQPCKVPNSALRENSKLTDKTLENVPLTLASGEFQIVLHNGDSNPSNAVSLVVP